MAEDSKSSLRNSSVDAAAVGRRRLLQLGAGGLLSPLWSAASVVARPFENRINGGIRSCIFIFYYGGPSHLDTYDLKPNAPSSIRGEFQGIATTVPGLQISEHLPHMARVMHHCAVIRSMHHTNRLHDSASIETHTGRQASQGDREEFAPIPQFFPCHGSAISYFQSGQQSAVSHAALPFVFRNVIDVPCQGGGFLGTAVDPFRITVDPDRQNYLVEELQAHDGMTSGRMRQRSELLQRMNGLESGAISIGGLDQYYDRAFRLLDSGRIAAALDLSQETPEMRDRYGVYSATLQGSGNGAHQGFARHMRGQNLLIARRLVEAGVAFINVFDFRQQGQNWDSHAGNFAQHRDVLLPPADKALAALITDLEERGLLESTLVVATGEFGRTPQINRDAGRDHWPDCYSLVLAGGGVEGGAIYGASDAQGAYPDRDPVTPADLAATIYSRFGLDPFSVIHDRTSRPWHLADGRPLSRLFRSQTG